MPSARPKVDILIPVYNEGKNIVRVLEALRSHVHAPFRILICYDFDEDDTLEALGGVELGKNEGQGAHQAILTGFAASTSPFVLVYPADDDYNAGIVDQLVARAEAGA